MVSNWASPPTTLKARPGRRCGCLPSRFAGDYLVVEEVVVLVVVVVVSQVVAAMAQTVGYGAAECVAVQPTCWLRHFGGPAGGFAAHCYRECSSALPSSVILAAAARKSVCFGRRRHGLWDLGSVACVSFRTLI